MKKYMLLLSFSLIAFTEAKAYNVSAPLRDMQNFYIQEFKTMDLNGDNLLSEEEYVTHQVKRLKEALLQEATETNKKEEQASAPVAPKNELNALGDVNETLQNMAAYDVEEEEPLPPAEKLDFDEADVDELSLFDAAEELTETAAETKVEAGSELPANLEMLVEAKAGDDLKGIIDNMTASAEETVGVAPAEQQAVEPEKVADENPRIKMMMDMVKKTLPKKIDDITTWIDVAYENNEVAYIYQADVDVSAFSPEEQNLLAYSIKNEACTQATTQMCPKIKASFIDKGVNMKIKYQDKSGTEISFCELNKETCK